MVCDQSTVWDIQVEQEAKMKEEAEKEAKLKAAGGTATVAGSGRRYDASSKPSHVLTLTAKPMLSDGLFLIVDTWGICRKSMEASFGDEEPED